ncbi:glucose-6-phosphatase 3 [Pimephales promelas]|uniref:glucose-6-phosphatase 3 n=1 Tax=Pimephales promelas TaxID=90988 RepID=UPI001955E1FB|nr:glucose-6-phosphatase 3 [Pimephales promelas]KAG1933371.1 glucose-6-phosphatase [Pimephales promelas]
MENIHRQGVWVAEALQLRTRSLEDFWLVASHMGDPKAAVLLVFPVVFYIHRRTGIAVLWVAALSEWLNLVLKWFLFGERPYWWIGESGLFSKNPPKVQQFLSTCETGPGSPSGHAMVTSAVWWLIVSALASFFHTRTGSKILAAVPYLLYAVFLGCVGLSRIFILAHFPHQVIAGLLTGVLLGIYLNRTVPECRPLLFFFCCSVTLLFGALVLHGALQKTGIDLSWSISLAKRWCSHAEWIRLDTAPFSSLNRDAGVLLGLGLAQYWKPGGWALPWVPRTLCLALSSMALHYISSFPLPTVPPLLFYSLFFLKYTIVPQVVMVLVPGFVHLLTAKPKRE